MNGSLVIWQIGLFALAIAMAINLSKQIRFLFNMMAPGVIEQHLTAGFTHRVSSGREYSLSIMYAPKNTIQGPNSFDPTQSIELDMHQFEIEFGYSW